MRYFFICLALAGTVLTAGCAGREDPAPMALTPIPEAALHRDPDDAIFMQAIADYIALTKAPGNSRYEFTRIDLDGDGRREGLALFKTPHQHWCDLDGCRMAVFKASNDHFALLSEIFPVRGPLTVSNKSTSGWRDIIVRVSGRINAQSKDVALAFDGRGYPSSPPRQPPVEYAFNDYGGVRIFP